MVSVFDSIVESTAFHSIQRKYLFQDFCMLSWSHAFNFLSGKQPGFSLQGRLHSSFHIFASDYSVGFPVAKSGSIVGSKKTFLYANAIWYQCSLCLFLSSLNISSL